MGAHIPTGATTIVDRTEQHHDQGTHLTQSPPNPVQLKPGTDPQAIARHQLAGPNGQATPHLGHRRCATPIGDYNRSREGALRSPREPKLPLREPGRHGAWDQTGPPAPLKSDDDPADHRSATPSNDRSDAPPARSLQTSGPASFRASPQSDKREPQDAPAARRRPAREAKGVASHRDRATAVAQARTGAHEDNPRDDRRRRLDDHARTTCASEARHPTRRRALAVRVHGSCS